MELNLIKFTDIKSDYLSDEEIKNIQTEMSDLYKYKILYKEEQKKKEIENPMSEEEKIKIEKRNKYGHDTGHALFYLKQEIKKNNLDFLESFIKRLKKNGLYSNVIYNLREQLHEKESEISIIKRCLNLLGSYSL